ncbi:hypothetical protein BWQ96_08853 [Gracilariopsis chorda]|uniref:Uncharacterized protein n=1 Tax=Gracilariopsis chorda TaxID=448386 RepID=A0A2V3IHA3_9FLOR|nr:hypothetical protein BWQ96_08853 [Gracilariopsis chorda]|eukprot:PXF41418.1 hypothetical protein BWQ96_08853 [Gracilariopsis chorda]
MVFSKLKAQPINVVPGPSSGKRSSTVEQWSALYYPRRLENKMVKPTGTVKVYTYLPVSKYAVVLGARRGECAAYLKSWQCSLGAHRCSRGEACRHPTDWRLQQPSNIESS